MLLVNNKYFNSNIEINFELLKHLLDKTINYIKNKNNFL